MVTSILPDFGPARDHAAFRRLLAGDLLSTLGGSMTNFAVVLQIWDLSRSSLDVGLLGLTFVPVLIVGLLGGSIADAMDRRALALVTTLCLMGVSAGFAVQAYAQSRQLWLLYAAALIAFTIPALTRYRAWAAPDPSSARGGHGFPPSTAPGRRTS